MRPVIDVNITSKEVLPEFLFERIINYIDTSFSIYDEYVISSLAFNFIKERNGFILSIDQFHRLVDEVFTTYVKNNVKWYTTIDPGTYAEMFGFIGLFLQMNEGALFTEENILYILNSFITNVNMEEITEPETLMDMSDGPFVNNFPSFGVERIVSILSIDTSSTPYVKDKKIEVSGAILDFFCEHYDKFLIKARYFCNSKKLLDQKFIIPGLQAVIPWPKDFVKDHADVFLAPVLSLNPLARDVAFQQILFGKLTENFINILYESIDTNIPKVERTDDDVLLSLISYSKI